MTNIVPQNWELHFMKVIVNNTKEMENLHKSYIKRYVTGNYSNFISDYKTAKGLNELISFSNINSWTNKNLNNMKLLKQLSDKVNSNSNVTKLLNSPIIKKMTLWRHKNTHLEIYLRINRVLIVVQKY